MDADFRNGTPWEQMSRIFTELGHHRSPKECKEMMEDVQKNKIDRRSGRPPAPDLSAKSILLESSDDYDDYIDDDDDNRNKNNSGRSSRKRSRTSVEKNWVLEEIVEKVVEKREMRRQLKREQMSKDKMAIFLEKLETMQQRFLNSFEKLEKERMSQEAAWKMASSSRDTAILDFLRKLSDQLSNFSCPTLPPQKIHQESKNNDDIEPIDPSGKRWPEKEVHKPISLRSQQLEFIFQGAMCSRGRCQAHVYSLLMITDPKFAEVLEMAMFTDHDIREFRSFLSSLTHANF